MMKVASAISVAIRTSSSRSRMRSNIYFPSGLAFSFWPALSHSAASIVASVGRAPRLLEEFIDQGLADALCHIMVNRIERLAHRGVLLRRQRHDLALASLLDV